MTNSELKLKWEMCLEHIAEQNERAEYEILFKDFAPFGNIIAHHFPKQKQLRCA